MTRRVPARGPDYRRLLAAAVRLVGLSLAWNTIEAVVALGAAWTAGSLALAAFGLDSVIETAASALMLTHLGRQRATADDEVERRERFVRRAIGWSFVFLAVATGWEAFRDLQTGREAATSPLGIALAVLSLAVMPTLAAMKRRVALRLRMRSLEAEAQETLACAFLSGALLVGLAGRAWFGWAWADPVAAGLMVPWLIREGVEAIRDDD